MEDFIINIIATFGFGVILFGIVFLIYYLYLNGNGKDIQEEGKDKKLGKRILK